MPSVFDTARDFLFGNGALRKAAAVGDPPRQEADRATQDRSSTPAYSQREMVRMAEESARQARERDSSRDSTARPQSRPTVRR